MKGSIVHQQHEHMNISKWIKKSCLWGQTSPSGPLSRTVRESRLAAMRGEIGSANILLFWQSPYFSLVGGTSLRAWTWFQHLENLGRVPVQVHLGGVSLETFSKGCQLKKRPVLFISNGQSLIKGITQSPVKRYHMLFSVVLKFDFPFGAWSLLRSDSL